MSKLGARNLYEEYNEKIRGIDIQFEEGKYTMQIN